MAITKPCCQRRQHAVMLLLLLLIIVSCGVAAEDEESPGGGGGGGGGRIFSSRRRPRRRRKKNPVFALAVSAVLLAVVVIRQSTAKIYDVVITRLTKKWYEAVLESFPDGSRILDIGVGTLSALVPNVPVVKRKRLTIVGIDYEAAYVRAARRRIQELDLHNVIDVKCLSVYDDLAALGSFDGAYFSGSITLMPDPVAALRAAANRVRPGGTIHCTQTYQRKTVPMLATIKPLLKYVTTIDFGQLTTEARALQIFKDSGLHIAHHKIIPGSVDTSFQAAYHTILDIPEAAERSAR